MGGEERLGGVTAPQSLLLFNDKEISPCHNYYRHNALETKKWTMESGKECPGSILVD